MTTWIIISIPLIILNGFIIYLIKSKGHKGGKLPDRELNNVIWTPQNNCKPKEQTIDFTEGVEVVYSKNKEFIQTSDTLEAYIEIKNFNKSINTERLI